MWDVKTSRYEGGFTLEMIIPFKSLRYRAAGPQTWGINIRRVVKSKNEVSNLTRVPAAYGTNGVVADGDGRHARRPRDARAVDEPRVQAVRRLRR